MLEMQLQDKNSWGGDEFSAEFKHLKDLKLILKVIMLLLFYLN